MHSARDNESHCGRRTWKLRHLQPCHVAAPWTAFEFAMSAVMENDVGCHVDLHRGMIYMEPESLGVALKLQLSSCL